MLVQGLDFNLCVLLLFNYVAVTVFCTVSKIKRSHGVFRDFLIYKLFCLLIISFLFLPLLQALMLLRILVFQSDNQVRDPR